MKEFFKIMEKDMLKDDCNLFDSVFYICVILAMSVIIFLLVSVLNWLVMPSGI